MKGPGDQNNELEVHFHSNRPSTLNDDGTKNGDPHNDSNIPPASTVAVAEMIEWHTSPWNHQQPEEVKGTRRTPEADHKAGDGYQGSTCPRRP